MSVQHRPRKRFGQNFLINPHIADRIVEAAAPGIDELVLEIGPGKGVLTERLLNRAARVWAVEIDRDLIPGLLDRYGGDPRFHLIESDILEFDPAVLDSEGRIRVVANIPYYITTPIIEYLILHRDVFSGGILMMQRETAARILSGPGSREYGLTSLNFALYGGGRKLFDVKPGAFHPQPEVMSSVVELEIDRHSRFPLRDERMFRLVTGAVFRQRRKMIRNTFIHFAGQRGISTDVAFRILEAAGISPEARPETVGIGAFVMLANLLSECAGKCCTPHEPDVLP